MFVNRVITSLAATVAIAGIGLTASPADAATGYVGKVNSNVGLNARSLPTSAAPRAGNYGDDTRLRLVCKVSGVSIGGNDLWYMVRGNQPRWVSARYVDNIGPAPRFCGDGSPTSSRVTTDRLNRREAPTLLAATDGVLKRNARVSLVCWLPGLEEGPGDSMWFQLGNGSWVSADYLAPTRPRVGLCA